MIQLPTIVSKLDRQIFIAYCDVYCTFIVLHFSWMIHVVVYREVQLCLCNYVCAILKVISLYKHYVCAILKVISLYKHRIIKY